MEKFIEEFNRAFDGRAQLKERESGDLELTVGGLSVNIELGLSPHIVGVCCRPDPKN